jgi:MYXO-CTERM domain-containing protein
MTLSILSVLASPFLCPQAQAGEFIDEVGDVVKTGTTGTWTRMFPTEDGWWLVFGASGRMNVAALEDDNYTITDNKDVIALEGEGLADTVMVECPSGNYLMSGSTPRSTDAEQAFAWMYSPEWETIGGGAIAEDQYSDYVDVVFNDMALVCSSLVRAVGFVEFDGLRRPVLIGLDENGEANGNLNLPGTSNLEGGSIAPHLATETFYTVGTHGEQAKELTIDHYGFEGDEIVPLETRTVDMRGLVGRVWWPQGHIKVGDYWILAFMGDPIDEQFQGGEGDVYVAVLDSEWTLVELENVTNFSPPVGGSRPSIARKGSTLLVSFDKETRHHAVPLELNLVALGYQEGSADSGQPDSAGPTAEDDTGSTRGPGGEGCGCAAATSSPLAGLGWIGVLGLWIRRRRSVVVP